MSTPPCTPPFQVSAEAINQVACVSALVERYVIRMQQKDASRLRKVNRIRAIHSFNDGNGCMGRQVRAHLATLKEAGLIDRQGSRKVGRWVVKGA